MRILGTILLTLIVTLGFSQVDPEQIYQAPGRDYVLLSTDTLNSSYPINGIYVPTRLKDSIFFKSDSICISIFDDGRPEKCLLMPEGGGGSSDTLSYWIFQVNGGVDDTIYQAERINLVAGTRITITGGTDNPTINADSCLQRLEQLTDSTFQITDCAGSPLDTILISGSGGGGGTITLPKSRFVFTDPITGELTTNGTWGDSLLLYNGGTRYGQIDDKGNVSWGWLAAGSGNNNTRIGGRAGYRNQGDHNTYLGFQSGYLSLSDTHLRNTAIGYETAYEASGDDNLYMGQHSGWYNISDYSVYLGAESGYMTVSPSGSSDNNLAMGYQAARDAEGDNNVYLGNQSGYGTLGSNNIFIGSISTLVGSYSDRFALGGPSDFFMDGDMSTDSLTLNSTLTIRDIPAMSSPDSMVVIGPDHELNSYPISGLQTAPDSLEIRGDSIGIVNSNAVRLFDIIDTTGFSIDTDSQSLSLINDTLSISRGNSVVLSEYRDTVKLKPFHEVWTNSDSTLTVNAGFDTLVTYNDSIRWKLLDNRIDAIALGKGARSDHYNSTALGARAFPYLQDTLVHPFNSTQVDTANEWIDGLGSFISHLNDLGYQTGDIVVIKWSLTSGEMPFIDTAQDLRVAEGIHAFTITSPSLLSPVQFGFDSVPTGAYTLQANQYLTGSTAIGHDAVVDKANQIALGDSTSQELKLGDSIRMKIDTNYTHFQLVGFDSTYNQLIPIDAAAFGFTPDADWYELEVDAPPGDINDDIYTLGQVVIAADTSINTYYLQVPAPNGNAINVRDPYDDDVEIMWSGDTYSWVWRQLDEYFELKDGGAPGEGTGVYINAIHGYNDPAAILELQADGGMQWSNYGIGSPRNGGSDFYAIPFVDGGGGVYQLRPDDFLDSLDLSDIGDSSGVVIPTGQVYFGNNTRAPEGSDSLFWATATGRLGIGTNSPAANVHIYDSGNNYMRFEGAGDYTEFRQIATQLRINNNVASGNAGIDLNPVPLNGSSSAFFRFFRETNTTGSSYFGIYEGDGSASQNSIFYGKGGHSYLNGANTDLYFGVGTSSPNATLNVDGTVRLDNLAADGVSGVLYYDAENDIGKRSLANLQSDLGVLWTDGGTTSYLTSTSDRVHIGGTSASRKLQVTQNAASNVGQLRLENTNASGDATLEMGAGGVYGAIGMDNSGDLIIAHHDNVDASRAIFVNASANVGIAISPSYRLDVNGTFHASGAWYDSSGDAGTSGQVLSSTGSASNWIDVADNSSTNELQNLSYTAATRVMAISSGTNATIPLFTSSAPGLVGASGGGTTNFLRADGSWAAPSGGGGGGGIYDGSDNLTSGTTTATILSGSVFNFQYNTGDSELTISGTGTFLRSNPSGASNAVELDAGGVSIEAASGDQIDLNVAGGTNEIVIDGTDVYINDGMLVGGSSANYLRLGSTSGYAWAGHVDGGFGGKGVFFYDDPGEILIDGEDVTITADDEININSGGNILIDPSSSKTVTIEGLRQFIGGTTAQQLAIYAQATGPVIYNETELSGAHGSDDSYIFLENSGDIDMSARSAVGSDINLLVNDRVYVEGDLDYTGDLSDVSDRRLKKNIRSIEDPYSKILALRPVHYNMKSDNSHEYGYIAQDYQNVFPDQVKTTGDHDYLAIIKGSAEVYTTAAVQQLIKEVQQLKSEIETLKSRK